MGPYLWVHYSQILPYVLMMKQSALCQPRKMTVQIATIGIGAVFALFAVNGGRPSWSESAL